MVLARPEQQQRAFDQFLEDQQNPASPEFHHWLTPKEIGERFGLALEDVNAVTSWLQGQGLHVNWIAPSRTFVSFGGTAADIDRAFHTELHTYTVNHLLHYATSSDPQAPAALAPAIRSIEGLYTVEDRPMHQMLEPQVASPQLTSNSGKHYLAPGDFARIYNIPSTLTGAGYTIGIVGRARTNAADFQNFMARTSTIFNLPAEVVPVAFGGSDPGPALTTEPANSDDADEQSEATLDVLRTGSTATAAKLLLVVATGASGGIGVDTQYLVQSTPAPAQIISISYGNCESAVSSTTISAWDSLFKQAAAEGISVFVASGDSGASGCDANFSTPPANPKPNSPNYLCVSSYVTCVGGTQFNDTTNTSLYWNPTSSNITTATGYIPEGGWNEPLTSSSKPTVAASGGGVSLNIQTPSWQVGTGVPSERAGRYTPDISFSGACHDGYFACFAARGADCTLASDRSFHFVSFCGTSASAPGMAGVAALLDQQKGARQGNLNPALYATALSYPDTVHDVTVRTSGVTACDVNTPSMCNNSIPSSLGLDGGQAGYLVTDGFDLVTGLGSLNVGNFLDKFTIKAKPTVTITTPANSISVLKAFSVTVAVSSSSSLPTPTGTISLTSGSYSSTSSLVNGSATLTIPAQSLSVGYVSLSATYTPDSSAATTYSSSRGDQSVLINLDVPPMTVTPSKPRISSAEDFTIAVSVGYNNSLPAPKGSVSLNGFGNTTTLPLANGTATFSLPAGSVHPGGYTVSASYVADRTAGSLYADTGANASLLVSGTAANTPSVTLSTLYSDIATLQTTPVSIVVTGSNGLAMPTGTVRVMSGTSYSSDAVPLVNGGTNITVPAGALPESYTKLAAYYTPDATSGTIYNNASGSLPIRVWNIAQGKPVIKISPYSTGVSSSSPIPLSFTVTGPNGFPAATGSITLTSGTYNSGPVVLKSSTASDGLSASITIPGNTLPAGNNTLTATYTPDDHAAVVVTSGNTTTTITVNNPTFTLNVSPITVGSGSTGKNTVMLSPAWNFSGTVTLSAAITSSPAGARNLPVVTIGSDNPVNVTTNQPIPVTVVIATSPNSASTTGSFTDPRSRWYTAGGLSLAALLFCLPTKRRWRTGLRAFGLFLCLASFSVGCGGGGKSNNSGGGSDPGTTKGSYGVTVTGTSGGTTSSVTFVLTVS